MGRAGKGDKDRTTLLPSCLVAALKAHLDRVKALHDRELAAGHGDVELPYALQVKYPRAAWEWAWQYVFPGHNSVETTMIYTHVMRGLASAAVSPLDQLLSNGPGQSRPQP